MIRNDCASLWGAVHVDSEQILEEDSIVFRH